MEDKLFATLDATSRKVERKGSPDFLLVDTVGFIRKLPHTLVDAFRSTLEEAAVADVLCIVSDASSPKIYEEHEVVCQVLDELGATEQPRIELLNKWDKADTLPDIYGGIPVSAVTGEGIEELLKAIDEKILGEQEEVIVFLPFSKYHFIGDLRQLGKIINEEHEDEGSRLTVQLNKEKAKQLTGKYGEYIEG